ncbi:MAG: hypothetical protein HQM09_00965 [Candidatus Riflebacteria bacterium]|nr:hypothetical protein [Candidatus Riflebacteria bacterium]
MNNQPIKLFETHDDVIVAFVGEWGTKGVFRWSTDEWTFFQHGSREWDQFHQMAFGTFRADPITPDTLAARGIPSPPDQAPELPPLPPSPPFDPTQKIPLAETWPDTRPFLTEHPDEMRTFYLILFEDLYESYHGDGTYLYPHTAYLDKEQAERDYNLFIQITLRDTNPSCGYNYTMVEIPFKYVSGTKHVESIIQLDLFEHYSLFDILRQLIVPGMPPAPPADGDITMIYFENNGPTPGWRKRR